MAALLILLYFGLPALLLALRKRWPWIEKVGVVTLSYVVGIILGNLGFVPIDEALAKEIMGPAVALSIPLLLFSTDLKTFKTAAPALLKSFACCVVAVTLMATTASFLFADRLAEVWKLGAMTFGVYTGGTVNLSSIGIAIDASDEAFVLINAADLIWGGILLLFLLTVAKPVYAFLLGQRAISHSHASEGYEELDDTMFLKGSSIAFLIAAAIVGMAIGISYLVLGTLSEIVLFLAVTAFGIAASTIPYVKGLNGSYGLGNYLLYVFCVAVGSLANVQEMIRTGGDMIMFVGLVVIGSLLIHLLLARLLRLDADSVIIASTAGLYGPPFIAPIARATNSTYLIPLGITLSLVGFVIGNYGGIALGSLLRIWLVV